MNSLKMFGKKFKLTIIVISILSGSILTFSFVADDYFEISKNLDIFYTLVRELNLFYVDEVKPDKLIKTGIDDML